jgi:apolipoprotein N-acyltransferase
VTPTRSTNDTATRLATAVGAVTGATPARQRIHATLAGALSVLAMAPFHVWPVLWLTLPVLLLTLDASRRAPDRHARVAPWRRTAVGRAAEIGWWFGFGYYLCGLYWIAEPFLVEAEIFAWLLPFAVTLMPAGLALFTAAAAGPVVLVAQRPAFDRIVTLAIGFGLTEWLRGHIFTGLPWNVLGYALTAPLPLMQSAGLFGIYGLTVCAVLVFAAPYAALAAVRPARRRWMVAAASLLPLALLFGYGALRLAGAPMAPSSGPLIRVVQPSIPQRERLAGENQRRIFDAHLALSQTAANGVIDGAEGIDVLVWPEAAMPFVPLAQPIAMTEIGRLLRGTTHLVSGALRLEQRADHRDVFNSLLVFSAGTPARHTGTYDKIHLVPFGEYLPAQPLLEAIGLQQLTRQRGGFAAGAGPRRLLDIAGLGHVLPLICYEAIFPGLVPDGARPNLLLTLTNDGWFGTHSGPYQHYHQGRVRAVETGVPLLRASSNGISAMVDGLGRERARLGLNVVGTFDTRVPDPVSAPLYARWGDMIFWGVEIILLMMMLRRTYALPDCKTGVHDT